jgi:diguanylate cyclase (GGDEF)-like protein
LRWIVAGMSIVVLAATGGAIATDQRVEFADERARTAAETVAEIEMLQLRADLRRTHLDELNLTMLAEVWGGPADATELATDARIQARAAARSTLDALTTAPGPTSFEAVALRQYLTGDGIDGGIDGGIEDGEVQRRVDPNLLFDTQYHVSREDRPGDELLDAEILGLYELIRGDSAGALVLNDALDAAYVLGEPTVPEYLASYAARADPYIWTEGGYFGPDPARPFTDGWVVPAAHPADPALADVEAVVAGTELWTYDQWIQTFPAGDPGPSPIPLEELAAIASVTDATTRALVDERLGERLDAARSTVDAQETESFRSRVVSVTLSAVAVMSLLGIIGLFVRRGLVQRRSLVLDPLTGVGNRRVLDTESARHLADRDLRHHVVVAVDLDRFKMVNDGWGHAVGDQVLIEVARRLREVVATLTRNEPRTVGTVVRMGGDEFVLTLHSVAPIDTTLVAARLTSVRSFTMPVGNDLLTLSFSVGIAESSGGIGLDDLVRQADLAAYESKSARATELGDRRSGRDVQP